MEIPPEILAAAHLVGDYMARQGHNKWELANICSRNHAIENERLLTLIHNTTAILQMNHPVESAQRRITETVLDTADIQNRMAGNQCLRLLPRGGAERRTMNTNDSSPASVDPVKHPPHYTQHPSGVECIQVTECMNFCLGNAVKYIWRAALKNDALDALEKARWYVSREIERRKRQNAPNERRGEQPKT